MDEVGAGSAPGDIEHVGSCMLPTPWATFRLHGFVDPDSGAEHLALVLGDVDDGAPVLARVHSECLTGDALFSRRCDCGAQLQEAMQRIAAEGRGVVLYLRQEGRGIGLSNKIRAYRLQDCGADTVDANLALGFEADLRRYEVCRPMLAHLGVRSLRLMSNSPAKVEAVRAAGVEIAERVGIEVGLDSSNLRYLRTKQARMGHLFSIIEDEAEG
ncbi:MAG: GTP cyclohydrolase II [Burkholderiaceae bacterium]|nr:GTP cyclohydrolase II [Burkholderiaceae bacterium]